MVAAKQTEDTHLGEEVERYWGECVEQNYVFDRLEKEVSHGLLMSNSKKFIKNPFINNMFSICTLTGKNCFCFI